MNSNAGRASRGLEISIAMPKFVSDGLKSALSFNDQERIISLLTKV